MVTCVLNTTDLKAQSLGTSYKTALGVKVWDGAGWQSCLPFLELLQRLEREIWFKLMRLLKR